MLDDTEQSNPLYQAQNAYNSSLQREVQQHVERERSLMAQNNQIKSIQMATEAAITILRIDDFVITN